MKYAMMLLAVPALAFQVAKPTPREKAHELLDAAVETAGGAQPEVAASAMLYIGENYDLFDHKKALEYLQRAFAATVAIPPGKDSRRADQQARVAAATAPLSLPVAIEMLKQIQPGGTHDDERLQAINAIVSRLIEKKQFDEAIDLINSIGSTGQYPFAAARQVFEKLPPEDGRRLAIFGYAMSAYALRPGQGFSDFLARRWREIPRTTAEAAIGPIVKNILDEKNNESFTETVSNEKGSVSLHSRQDVELFDLMHVVSEIDPKRAAEILDTRPELRSALQRFPQGRLDMGDSFNRSTTSGSGRPDPAAQQRAAVDGIANTRAERAMAALAGHDLPRAIEIAKTIPVAGKKVEVLTSIANAAGTTDQATARSVIGDCIGMLKDVKDAGTRAASWNNIAEAAHKAGDDKLAWDAIDRSLADSAELYKTDVDADAPNAALRDQWPSTNAYRHAIITATKLMGVDADALLTRITDPDLALFARVELAQALLERPHESWSTSVSRTEK